MKTYTDEAITGDPLVSRAARRSGFAENGDRSALEAALQYVLWEVERALPGVDVSALRTMLNSPVPLSVDLRQLFLELVRLGRTTDQATEICVAIEPTFMPVLAA